MFVTSNVSLYTPCILFYPLPRYDIVEPRNSIPVYSFLASMFRITRYAGTHMMQVTPQHPPSQNVNNNVQLQQKKLLKYLHVWSINKKILSSRKISTKTIRHLALGIKGTTNSKTCYAQLSTGTGESGHSRQVAVHRKPWMKLGNIVVSLDTVFSCDVFSLWLLCVSVIQFANVIKFIVDYVA